MQIVEAPVVLENPSMTQLRDLIEGKSPEPETQAETSGTVAEENQETQENEHVEAKPAETAEEDETEEVAEEQLPKGVQKQIEREAKKQAEYNRRIEEAKSKTKQAKEEAERLERETGTEPEKPARKGDDRPTFPDIRTFNGTEAEFYAAVAKYEKEYPEWLQRQTRDTVRAELERERQQKALDDRWSAAVAEHGEASMVKADDAIKATPEGMQIAISALDHWSKVAIHLADNPKELEALAAQFKANPYTAIAALGKLEAKLSAPAPKPEVKEKELPPPLKRAPAAAGTGDSSFDWSKATMAQKRAHMVRTGLL